MTLAPPSPRFSVSSPTRVPRPRDSYVSMPPSSSSGCAVTMIRLARVRSFFRLCQSAAEPCRIEISRASVAGSFADKYGGCASAPAAITSARTAALLLDDRAIGPPDLPPSAVQAAPPGTEGRLGCFLLVDLDAPAGLLAHIEVAVLFLGNAVEDLLGPLVELGVFEHAEVVRHHAERDVGHVADR